MPPTCTTCGGELHPGYDHDCPSPPPPGWWLRRWRRFCWHVRRLAWFAWLLRDAAREAWETSGKAEATLAGLREVRGRWPWRWK